jgi:hypothetical protein
MSAAKKDKHEEDDLRGNFILKVGEVKEEKTYFKVRLGNNREDVTSFRAQIKDECGKDAGLQSFWAYLGSPIAGLPTEGTHKSKDGGVWIDMNAAGCQETLQVTNFLPKEDIQGELFIQIAATSDKSFKEGFYNSFHLSLSLDGSHEFAHNFGKFLVKNQYVSMHEKLLLNIIKKFKEFDFAIDLETMDNLDKDLVKSLLLEGTDLENSMVEEITRMLRRFFRQLSDNKKEISQAVSTGMRLVVLINNNMYANVELKGQDAFVFLEE